MKKSLFLTLLAAVALTGCKKDEQTTETAPEYAVETVALSETDLQTSYPASIEGRQDIEVRPKVSGYLTALKVDEGAQVRRGQTLFTIDDVQYRASVKSAQANVNVCKATVATQELEVQNKRTLHEQGIVSDYALQVEVNRLAQYRAQLEAAVASLESAQDNLRYCTVSAPADGVIGTIPYRVGSLVSASSVEPLTTLSSTSEVYVYFSMTEKQLLEMSRTSGSVAEAVRSLPAVNLQLSDGTMYEQTGVVSTVSGKIDQSTGAVRMRATFPNGQGILRSGGTGNIVIPSHQKDVIIIQQKCVTEIQNKKFVYVVKTEGGKSTVESREITVLPQHDGVNYVVTDGLKQGDRIVVEGVNKLKAGAEITPITPEKAAENLKAAKQDVKDGKMPGQ